MEGIASIDLFVVPTIAFEQLFAFLVLGHGRAAVVVDCGDPKSDGRVVGTPNHPSVSVGEDFLRSMPPTIMRCEPTFLSGRTRPTHVRSSGSETLLRIRFLAGCTIDTHESSIRKRHAYALHHTDCVEPDSPFETEIRIGVRLAFGNPGTTETTFIAAVAASKATYVLSLHGSSAVGIAAGYALITGKVFKQHRP
jgi:hypothetical protein